MKRITLPKIQRSLERMEFEDEVEPEIARRARRAIERMLAVGRGEAASAAIAEAALAGALA
jgi:quinolinate synthase